MASEIFAEFGLWALLVFWLLAHSIKWAVLRLEKRFNMESHFGELSSKIGMSIAVAVMTYGLTRQWFTPYETYLYINPEVIVTYALTLTAILFSIRAARYYTRRPWLFKRIGGRILLFLLDAWCLFQKDKDYTDQTDYLP